MIMPLTLAKNLIRCFTDMKRPFDPQSSQYNQTLDNCFLTHHNVTATTTTATTPFLKTFNSLYDSTFPESPRLSSSSSSSSCTSSYSHLETTLEPDITTIFASQRFFFSSPGRSNHIIDSSSTPSTSTPSPETTAAAPAPIVNDSIAIPTYSPDPYADFRRSMQEMVEARELKDVKANWDFLHEMLLCYLALNPRSTHKFIVGAFADLLVTLMSLPPPGKPRGGDKFSADGGGGCKVSGEVFVL